MARRATTAPSSCLPRGRQLNALAEKLDLQPNAIYKVIFDARRKIRRALVANGYLDEPEAGHR